MTTISHIIPSGETIDFTVTVKGTERVLVEYPAELDLSAFKASEAYPVSEITEVVRAETGRTGATFADCTWFGVEGSKTVEVWSFAQ